MYIIYFRKKLPLRYYLLLFGTSYLALDATKSLNLFIICSMFPLAYIFKDYDKKQIISILSWFRSQGYTNALGNGNINNEKEIEDDYRDDPWKFIYEFVQNVDDCSYKKENTPKLNISISDKNDRIVWTMLKR